MTDEFHDDFEADQRVIHSSYGTGTVIRSDDTSPSIMVDFDRRQRCIVDDRDLEPARELLEGVDVEEGKEWADEPPEEGDSLIYGGEVEIDLDFADNVAYDVDVRDDGHIIIQYWSERR